MTPSLDLETGGGVNKKPAMRILEDILAKRNKR